jgi:NAD(P)-dependent dehydrogenase (short-subunit alcohol dehydrogenase family)
MELKHKNVVVTGAGSGIGKALCRRFSAEGANVVVADINFANATLVANEIDGLAVACDVSQESDIKSLVEQAEDRFGAIDLFCSNAGIGSYDPDLATSSSNKEWQQQWDVHVMAHVWAARAVLPSMIERGSGYFLQTASAAGLLSQIGSAAYSTTKHAAIGFAESLAISHGDDGIDVSVICPQYVATGIIGMTDDTDVSDNPEILTTSEVAEVVIQGIADKQFLILPHPQVEIFRQRKAADYDRWLGGMRKLRRSMVEQ